MCGFPGHFGHALVESEDVQFLGQLVRIAAEGAGSQQIHPGVQIGLVDAPQYLGAFHAKLFRTHAHGQAGGLQHGAHGPVEQQRTPEAERLSECHVSHFIHFLLLRADTGTLITRTGRGPAFFALRLQRLYKKLSNKRPVS